jgi:hypothetical protein
MGMLMLFVLCMMLPATIVQAQFLFITNNGTIAITGYIGPGGAVDIPGTINDLPVVSIEDEAFYNCTSITNITFPDSVTSIGNSAFYHCASLTNLIIGRNVTSIGDWAFQYCFKLAVVTISTNVTRIGRFAFSECNVLTNVAIPNKVTSIGDQAFYSCAKLWSVTIGGGVTSFGTGAFSYCPQLSNVSISYGCNSIGLAAFQYCGNLRSIVIPDSVTSIGAYAFYSCTKLFDVTIGNGVTSIGDSVFCYCSKLTNVTIPDSVTSLGPGTFGHCISLTSIVIPRGATILRNGTFSDCISLKGIYYKGNIPSLQVNVFSGDNNATNYFLPEFQLNWVTPFGGLPSVMATWLVVFSENAGAFPPVGLNPYDGIISCSASITNSPIEVGATQFVCKGWVGTGCVPSIGNSTNTGSFDLTNASTIVWLWTTNYWLDTVTNGIGNVDVAPGWQLAQSNLTVTATPDIYWYFSQWAGQTDGCSVVSNKIVVPMNEPRSIMAVFKETVVTNNVPMWWLAQYGLTNYDADAMRDIGGSGMLTWQKWVAGCDPTNPASRFCLTGAYSSDGEGVVIRWPSISNRFYDLLQATNLLAGTNAFTILPGASNMPATPVENSYTDTVQGVGPYFYKVNVHQ